MIKLVNEAVKTFLDNQRNQLRSVKITMAPDVYGAISDDQYYEWVGFRRYVDSELPEGHIRIIGENRHGSSVMLSKVKF
jgi:hypothetical protein